MNKSVLTVTICSLIMIGSSCKRKESVSKQSQDASNSSVEKPTVGCRLNVLRDVDRIIAELSFTNNGKRTVPFTKWRLLAEDEMTWWAFEITRGSTSVAYTCMMVKRVKPRPQDYYHLKPGETYVTKTEISGCYDFSEPGLYKISYFSLNSLPGESESFKIRSNSVELMIND